MLLPPLPLGGGGAAAASWAAAGGCCCCCCLWEVVVLLLLSLWLVVVLLLPLEEGREEGGRAGGRRRCPRLRHEYEYCDVCVNRSDDSMLDVYQWSHDHSATVQLRRSTTLPIELISDQRDMSVAGYKNAQIPSLVYLERKQAKRRITSLKLCNMKLDYTSRLMDVNTCAGVC